MKRLFRSREKFWEKAYGIFRENYGDQHHITSVYKSNLGEKYIMMLTPSIGQALYPLVICRRSLRNGRVAGGWDWREFPRFYYRSCILGSGGESKTETTQFFCKKSEAGGHKTRIDSTCL